MHNRVSSINKVAARLAELVPGGADRRRARPDERAHAREGDERVHRPGVRRAGVDHDRRVRPGHPERQHADRGPGRRLRPARPAPAARPGRPRPGAGLRLLPVSAGEAADRDGARAAGDAAAAHRDRGRPAHRDEGPGDPRGRQPARRRAVRARRGRRVRPVREDDRRGGPGAARATVQPSARRSGSSCRWTPTSRTTT